VSYPERAPAIQDVSRVFKMLFVDESAEQATARSEHYDGHGSILDAVLEQAQSMNKRPNQRADLVLAVIESEPFSRK
jgi:hypothetical protein